MSNYLGMIMRAALAHKSFLYDTPMKKIGDEEKVWKDFIRENVLNGGTFIPSTKTY